MNHLKMKSTDLTQVNIDKIAELFPNVITEARDEQGKIKRAIDFDLLRQELSGYLVEAEKERYQLMWPGKKEAILTANTPIDMTLRPVKGESLDWDSTQNLYIEGDNLEVLKLLQESYLNKIKLIYIDPPYNTGRDFVYKDDFREPTDEYMEESGQIDESGNRLFQNTESNGRFHSDWLTMMYARLKVARNLLREDGVILISIDDNEMHNLRKIADEVFGSTNLLATFVWKSRRKPINVGDSKFKPQRCSEYIYMYSKNADNVKFLPTYSGDERSYPHTDAKGKYRLTTILKSNRGGNERATMRFEINGYTPPEGQRWQGGESFIQSLFDDGYIEFKNGTPFRKYYEDEEEAEHDPLYTFLNEDKTGSSESGKTYLNNLLGNNHGFDTVKPKELLNIFLTVLTGKEEIVMDFFSGSATTADAVMQINADDGGNRKYIMVQYPVAIDEDSQTYKEGYKTICDIGKSRIRLAAQKIKEETGADTDYGYRVYRVDSSNMKDVYYTPDKLGQLNLEDVGTNIKEDRTGEDLLIQVMLEFGLELSLPMESRVVDGKTVHYVAGNSLIACFDDEVSEAVIKKIAEDQPLRVVFRDSSFRDDSARINVEELFKLLSPSTEIQVL
ncbi:Type III restriction-modification system methylation subunit [Paenibacillus pasadenensis]|uniref:Type III restriction-modification system methylation subunit n=1 Tax=Paenibacillus pasadenensis TaxID=217090 RepID=A0A2N5NCI1_9BACL|nr:site-specific DNA-methyltransferase [Paenibacillus pasadenensis]PLT48052.1 Type III restriction-modification system methylation subunit [Paenibacillus pasadenensis]